MSVRPFPHLDEYLSRLPEGLDSYRECLSKGALLRSSLVGVRPHPTWAALPAPIRRAIDAPPLPSDWVSTVITDAVFYVVADTYYPTDDAMLRWSYERTLGTADQPVYRMMTRVTGLPAFLRGAARFHGFFQRGTDMRVSVTSDQGDVVLSHPPHLHLAWNHLSNEAVFRAALDAAGAKESSCTMLESTPTLARYRARWRA
jgi:hypothetical protein